MKVLLNCSAPEFLGRRVRKSVNGSALPRRHLSDDARRCTEAVEAKPLFITRLAKRPLFDQPRTEEGKERRVVADAGIAWAASVIIGVAAAIAGTGAIVSAGTAGLLTGAMSMAAIEYVSVSAKADTEKAEISLYAASWRTFLRLSWRNSPPSMSSGVSS